MAKYDVGNVKSDKGEYFKVHWDNNSNDVWLSRNIGGPWYLKGKAKSREEALMVAKSEVDSIY